MENLSGNSESIMVVPQEKNVAVTTDLFRSRSFSCRRRPPSLVARLLLLDLMALGTFRRVSRASAAESNQQLIDIFIAGNRT